MKLSLFGRFALALFASSILGLGITGCGSYSVAFLWVLGQQYGQVAAFRVDNYTGNLTASPGQPFPSGGVDPVSIVVSENGRFVFVLNQGTAPSTNPTSTHYTSGNVSVFSVGGNGTLTFEQSYVTQGYDSQWMQLDSTGNYLFVLDKYSPSGDGNGAITSYAIDDSTGRLTLQQNQQSEVNGQPLLSYFEVGGASTPVAAPFMMKTAGSCVFVAAPNQIVPFEASNGQLVTSSSTGTFKVQDPGGANSTVISSIGGSSSYLTVTDTANDAVALFSVNPGCTPALASSGWTDLSQYGTVDPTYALIDASGQYLYVLNQQNINTNATNPYSTLDAFNIVANSKELELISGSPYAVGANPVCMIEDPTKQYLYVSNQNDGTVTGYSINSNQGTLSKLSRGDTFTAVGGAQCLAASADVD